VKPACFEHLAKVAESEIDELGHVNNAVYLSYAEAVSRAHAESVGLTLRAFAEHGVLPVVHRHQITYYQPAKMGDTLAVSTQVTAMGGPKAERRNRIRRAATGELLAEVITEWVWLEPQTLRPKRVPPSVAAAFGWEI
jgi:acyl-CoA thioester hydrolase